jgi:ribosomal protein L33
MSVNLKCQECGEVHEMIWIGMYTFMSKYECTGCDEINYIDDMYDEEEDE